MAEGGRISDAMLLRAAKQERVSLRHDAFEEILLRYERLVFHVTSRYFKSSEDALDASQEAALKIYNGLPSVTIAEDGNLKAWICTVTARVCLDILRKRRVQTTELTDDIHHSTEPSAEESAFANERAREVLSAVNSLSDDHRMMIILRDMQGLSYEELAETLGITIGTVKSRLSRARVALQVKLR